MKKEETKEPNKDKVMRRARLRALEAILLGWFIMLFLLNMFSGGTLFDALFSGDMDSIAAVVLGVLFVALLLISIWVYKYAVSYYFGKENAKAHQRKNDEKMAEIRRGEMLEEQKLGFTYQAAESFYAECLKNNITNLTSSRANCQRALLLAKSKKDWNIPNVEKRYMELFNVGRQRALEARQREADKKLDAVRAVEARRAAKAEELSEYRGREKRAKMLQDNLQEAERRLNAALQANVMAWGAMKNLSDASMEKEKDWSIAAGVASGIGGVVAGAAVAGDIASQNAGIRQRNEARKAAFADQSEAFFNETTRSNRDARGAVDKLKRQINETKLKLTDESLPAEQLMRYLKVENLSATPTEGEYIGVTAQVSYRKKLRVVEDVNGQIDGAVAAKIYRGDKEIGKAYLILPVFGLPYEKPTQLEGICTERYTAGEYRVELKPINLWLIEK